MNVRNDNDVTITVDDNLDYLHRESEPEIILLSSSSESCDEVDGNVNKDEGKISYDTTKTKTCKPWQRDSDSDSVILISSEEIGSKKFKRRQSSKTKNTTKKHDSLLDECYSLSSSPLSPSHAETSVPVRRSVRKRRNVVNSLDEKLWDTSSSSDADDDVSIVQTAWMRSHSSSFARKSLEVKSLSNSDKTSLSFKPESWVSPLLNNQTIRVEDIPEPSQDHLILRIDKCDSTIHGQDTSCSVNSICDTNNESSSIPPPKPTRRWRKRTRSKEEKEADYSSICHTSLVTHPSKCEEDNVKKSRHALSDRSRSLNCEKQALLPVKIELTDETYEKESNPIKCHFYSPIKNHPTIEIDSESDDYINKFDVGKDRFSFARTVASTPANQITRGSNNFIFSFEENLPSLSSSLTHPQTLDSDFRDYESDGFSVERDEFAIEQTNSHQYLIRNHVLCVYCFTHLPQMLPCTYHTMCHLQSCFIETCLEYNTSSGLSVLEDFCSRHYPESDLLNHLVVMILERRESERDLNRLNSLLLLFLQKIPHHIALTSEQIKSVILQEERRKSEVASFNSLLHFAVCFFEVDIFSRNLCDGADTRHSLTHSFLSLDECKQNVTLIMQAIENCLRLKACDKKASKLAELEEPSGKNYLAENHRRLTSLQRLINLGLMTVKDLKSSCRTVAKMFRSMIKTLNIEEKIIFLQTIGHPLVCLFTVQELMEEISTQYQQNNPKLPSIKALIKYFLIVTCSLPKNETRNEAVGEVIVLQYFALKSVIACEQDGVLEPMRKRILPGRDADIHMDDKEKDYILGLLGKLDTFVEKPTPTTTNFLLYTKCLISCL